MSNSKIIKGCYSLLKKKVTVFYHQGWYAVKGSFTAYYTDDVIDNEINLGEVIITDMIQSEESFMSLKQFIKFIYSFNPSEI